MEREKIKLLIIGMSMNIGGAEKSLINLLHMMDYEKYQVDLILFQKNGAFMKQIPRTVNLLEMEELEALFRPMKTTIRKYKGKHLPLHIFALAVKRYPATLVEKIRWKKFEKVRIHRWLDWYGKWIPEHEKIYDCGIAYAGGETTYYLADKTNCKRKVCFFHSDYSQVEIDVAAEKRYIEKMQQIFTISKVCQKSLEKRFPENKKKIQVLQNLTSVKKIRELGEEFFPDEYKKEKDEFILVSVGRLHKVKGYDMAVEAAGILCNAGMKFKWYIIGEGEERKKLEEIIREEKLEEHFFLLGQRENPYPYMRYGDLVVQTSRYEGKSIVLDEAKILEKPIVVTRYPSVTDQIIDGRNGMISPLSSEGIAKTIQKLMSNRELLEKIQENLHESTEQNLESVEAYLEAICKKEI